MPEQENENDNINEDKDGDKEELTLESLKELIGSQAGIIETLKSENANSISKVMQVLEEKYGLMTSDIQNLTNLLGNMAGGSGDDASGGEFKDLTDEKTLDDHIDKKLTDRESKIEENKSKESKAYFKEYGETVSELLNDELAPDGKPYSTEAREGIMNLLKKDEDCMKIYSKSGAKDAVKNFRLSNRKYYGLDRTHGFKGEDLAGTGGGGGTDKVSTKKTYKLTDESRKLLKDLGENEDWASKVLAEREA